MAKAVFGYFATRTTDEGVTAKVKLTGDRNWVSPWLDKELLVELKEAAYMAGLVYAYASLKEPSEPSEDCSSEQWDRYESNAARYLAKKAAGWAVIKSYYGLEDESPVEPEDLLDAYTLGSPFEVSLAYAWGYIPPRMLETAYSDFPTDLKLCISKLRGSFCRESLLKSDLERLISDFLDLSEAVQYSKSGTSAYRLSAKRARLFITGYDVASGNGRKCIERHWEMADDWVFFGRLSQFLWLNTDKFFDNDPEAEKNE